MTVQYSLLKRAAQATQRDAEKAVTLQARGYDQLDRIVADFVASLGRSSLPYAGAVLTEGAEDGLERWRSGVSRLTELSDDGSAHVLAREHVVVGTAELFEGRSRRVQPADVVKVVAFLVRRPGTTAAEFGAYWHDRHAPFALRICPTNAFGYGYVQHHAVDDDQPYDGVVEMYFRDIAHMQRWATWFNGPEGAPLRQDEHEFMIPDQRIVLVTREQVLQKEPRAHRQSTTSSSRPG